MLLPVVLPAVVEIRAGAVSRVYVNIEIGGSGGATSCHPRRKMNLDLLFFIFYDGRFLALVNQKLQTLQNRV